MNWCPTHKFRVAIVAAVCTMLLAVGAYAQFQSGNIFGKVQAKDGSVLPGVTVTLTGLAAPQTNVTDAQGNFRFLSLSPGTYSLKAELAGYGTAVRNGIGVRVAQNADVTLTLNPSVAESITVTAEAPILDVRKAGTGIDVSQVELSKVPNGRDPWVIMQQAPGVLMDRMNVGGNESGQQSGYVSKGSGSADSSWNVDGVNITDFGATGSTPTYYDFDTFEEMQLTTGGSDPRIQTPGVQINMVTKRGTNDYKGSARWFQTDGSWGSGTSIPAEAQSYLKLTNGISKISERGIEAGGPLWKDKAWFWGAFGRQNVNLLTPTLTTSGARGTDKTTLQNENLKLNVQPLSSNSFVATDMYGEKVKLGRNVGATRPPETGWNQGDIYAGGGGGSLTNPTMYKLEDTQIIGSSLYLTGLYSQVQGGFGLISDNGTGCTTYACGIAGPVAYFDSAGDGAWHRSYESYTSVRPQHQARLDGSKFFDLGNTNHELKFGFGYRHAIVNSASQWNGLQYTTTGPLGPNGNEGGVQFTRPNNPAYDAKYEDAYLGDTVLMGNLTIQAALRYDLQKGSNFPGTQQGVPGIAALPTVSYPGTSGLKWTNISPRVGLTYALGANKRTLLRAAYNRYASQLDSGTVTAGGVSQYSWVYYYFNDVNGDHIAQPSEVDYASGIIASGGINPNNPSAPFTQYTRWASNLKAPTTDEVILGVEHELLTDFSIGVDATYRKMNDFTQTIGEHTQGGNDFYGPSDYVLAPTPATATLPNGTKVSLPYYELKAGDSLPTYFVVRNRPGYYQDYKSLDLYATKRMSNRWMLRGNFTYQDWKQHLSASGVVDPTIQRGCASCLGSSDVIVGSGTGSGSFGGVYINSKYQYNVTALYQIPVVEMSFGVNLFGRQGYALPYVYRVSTPNGEGFKYLQATSSDTSSRNPNVNELDLRLAKDFNFFRGRGITLSVDAFNVLNSQTVLQRNVQRLNLSSSNHITELMAPRTIRLGARINF